MPDLTREALDELERLEREATPGLWRWQAIGRRLLGADGVSVFRWDTRDLGCEPTLSDKAFIAALRNAAPSLIAAARRLAAIEAASELTAEAESEFETYLGRGCMLLNWHPTPRTMAATARELFGKSIDSLALRLAEVESELEIYRKWKHDIEASGDKDGWANDVTQRVVNARLHCENAELESRLAEAERGLQAVADLISDSYGVAGLHKNGDIARWDELRTGGKFEDWLADFDKARELAQAKEG